LKTNPRKGPSNHFHCTMELADQMPFGPPDGGTVLLYVCARGRRIVLCLVLLMVVSVQRYLLVRAMLLQEVRHPPKCRLVAFSLQHRHSKDRYFVVSLHLSQILVVYLFAYLGRGCGLFQIALVQ
jgi:hypothetical protein